MRSYPLTQLAYHALLYTNQENPKLHNCCTPVLYVPCWQTPGQYQLKKCVYMQARVRTLALSNEFLDESVKSGQARNCQDGTADGRKLAQLNGKVQTKPSIDLTQKISFVFFTKEKAKWNQGPFPLYLHIVKHVNSRLQHWYITQTGSVSQSILPHNSCLNMGEFVRT